MRVWRAIVALLFPPSSPSPWGTFTYDVRRTEGGGVDPKADDTHYRLRLGCVSVTVTRGREGSGVENPQNFVDVICEFPLVLWVGRMSRQKISRVAQSEGGRERGVAASLRGSRGE